MPIPRSKPFWLTILGVVLAVNLAAGFCVYSKETKKQGGGAEALDKVGVMMETLQLIRQDYVDADNVSNGELMDNAIRGMVATLDPFSSYMTPAEFQEMIEMTEGRFGGLGIHIMVRNERLTVIAPMEGSPAAKAGILSGDQIIKIGEEETESLGMDEAMSRLRGEVGSPVDLTLHRPSTQKTFSLTLTRAEINVPSVTEVQMLDDGTGYLRIREFSDNTAEALQKALKEVAGKKAKTLVIDLRNNPGGVLESSVDACSLFLPPKSLVVYTEGRRPSQREEFLTTRGYKAPRDLRVAILINQGSASAAEIMSACLQDWGRAVLVGERSFGKGSVQNLIPLSDGGALRLTTAHYYTPSRQIIHEHGVDPDVTLALTEKEQAKLLQPDEATGDLPAKASPATDRQLKAALDLLQAPKEFDAKCRKRFKELPTMANAVPAPAAKAAAR